MYATSGGVAREGWGYGLGKQRQQGSGQVSEERTLVGLTRAPPSLRDSHKLYIVVLRVLRSCCCAATVAATS